MSQLFTVQCPISLDSILVMSSSGLMLYRRDYQHLATPLSPTASLSSSTNTSMQASVLATLVEVSQHATGLPLSFILLNSRAIAVSSQNSITLALHFAIAPSASLDEDTHILFRSFASTLAGTLLASFLALFPTLETRGVVASRDFDAFGGRIPDALRNTAKQILNELSLDVAISNCILVERDNVIHSTGGVEALSFLANLQVLNSTANDLRALPSPLSPSLSSLPSLPFPLNWQGPCLN